MDILLQEYFYNDGEKLFKLLGNNFIKRIETIEESDEIRYEIVSDMSDEEFLLGLGNLVAEKS